jgi:uncharacterized protein YjiS (DUF1127 family)
MIFASFGPVACEAGRAGRLSLSPVSWTGFSNALDCHASGLTAVARQFQGISPKQCHLARSPGEGLLVKCLTCHESRSGGGIGETNAQLAPYRVPGNAHVGGAGVVVSARGARKTTLPFASTSTRSRTHVHILTFAFDAAFRLYVSFRKRRDRRRTLRALANLDDRLLRDIGVTRGETAP